MKRVRIWTKTAQYQRRIEMSKWQSEKKDIQRRKWIRRAVLRLHLIFLSCELFSHFSSFRWNFYHAHSLCWHKRANSLNLKMVIFRKKFNPELNMKQPQEIVLLYLIRWNIFLFRGFSIENKYEILQTTCKSS